MITALELVEQEEERRDALVAGIRVAVARYYAVGGDRGFCTRRSEVHQVVAMELGFQTMRGQLLSLVNAIVTGMGGVPTAIGNRPVFLAMRRLEQDPKEARQRARAMKRAFRRQKPSRPRRAKKLTQAEVAEWERRLEAEGLGRVAALSTATAGGVHRARGRATQAAIYAGANDRVTDLLAELRKEVAVFELRAEGLALRPIGIKLGLDKMEVDAILKRVEARLRDIRPEV